MLHHRRIFQHFYSNRLRQHPFVSVDNHDTSQRTTHRNIVTHKNQIQHVDIADFIPNQIPKRSAVATSHQPLPFQAVPCADQQNTGIINRLVVIAHQMKRLITSNYDHRFHEEIDECHRRLGPIFRKSITPKISGMYLDDLPTMQMRSMIFRACEYANLKTGFGTVLHKFGTFRRLKLGQN